MISRSGSETPMSKAGAFTPRPDHMNSSITWVKDWYAPETSNISTPNSGGLKLKGWHKTNVNSNNDPAVKFEARDTLDLNSWKYYKEVAIVDHTQTESETIGDNQISNDEPSKEELGSALNVKDEGEIVSLSGITDT